MKKINVLINFINEKSIKYIDIKRLNVSNFYKCFNNIYVVLNFLYKNKNRVRDVRYQFKIFEIKFKQFFNNFYFEFIFFVNQLIDYLKKIKIDTFEKKITFKF